MKCYVIKTLTSNRVISVVSNLEKAKEVIENVYSKMNNKNGKSECYSINKSKDNTFKVNTIYTDESGNVINTQVFAVEETDYYE